MKQSFVLLLLICLTVQFTSCKTEQKKKPQQKVEKKAAFSLERANNTIDWIGYKTTDKTPVKGTFKKITIHKNGEGNSAKEAINTVEFSIPVSSIFTNNASRDYKLKKFFFGVMDKTKLLSGKLIVENDSTGIASITMNSVTADLPFTYTINGKKFELDATMDLSNWNSQNAIDSLNMVCKDLHKAADGISKTWSEVAIHITSVFQ
jgi:hypothetical protein